MKNMVLSPPLCVCAACRRIILIFYAPYNFIAFASGYAEQNFWKVSYYKHLFCCFFSAVACVVVGSARIPAKRALNNSFREKKVSK